jgi:colanic acid/amylovoran biosynthesis glycosyltransferase
MISSDFAIYCDAGFNSTFLKAHIDYLKPDFSLAGAPYPKTLNGENLHRSSLINSIFRRLKPERRNPLYPFEVFLSTNRPKVIIAEYGVSAAHIIDNCIAHNVPVIVNFYGYDAFSRTIVNHYVDAYARVFNHASYVCAQSNSIRQKLIELGCPESKIVVNAAPPEDVFFNYDAPSDTQTLISVGRFVDKKAPFAILFSFQLALKKFPNAKLIMVGDGPLLFSAKNLAKILGINESVVFTGKVDSAQQRAFMMSASIFIQHSMEGPDGDCEGLPVAIMEASAMAMPIVSTYHSGIPEAVEHAVTGLLSPEMDINTMADNIVTLLADPRLAVEMGKKGRSKMKAEFTMENHITRLRKMIGEASKT